MNKRIYGVDPDGKVSAEQVRDAIIECFFQAHCESTDLVTGEEESPQISKKYCKKIVKKAFNETCGDFDNPTKEDLEGVVEYLAEFSKDFRSLDKIEQNMKKINSLIKKVK